MKDDSIVAEVREARRQIAEACGNDIRKICEHADKAYEAFKKRVRRGERGGAFWNGRNSRAKRDSRRPRGG